MFPALFNVDVRVLLRGGNRGMSQDILYGADIGAARQQVGSKTVPAFVGNNF